MHIPSFQLSYAHAYSGEWTKWGDVSILRGYPHGYPPTSGVKEAACDQWGKHVHDRVFRCSFMWVTPSAIYCRQELTGVCHTDTQHVIWYREHTNIRTGEHYRDNVVWMLALFPGPYRNSGRGPVDVPPCDESAYLHSVHGCHTPSFHPPCTLACIYILRRVGQVRILRWRRWYCPRISLHQQYHRSSLPPALNSSHILKDTKDH